MKILLSSKQTPDQLLLNECVTNQFIMGVMNLDENLIKSLLVSNRKFLGRLNAWETMYWFRKKFELTKGENFRITYRKGISLDYYPGSEYYEFRFVFLDEFRDFDDSWNHSFEELSPTKYDFKIRLVLTFDNGKIADMRIPKNIIEKNIVVNYVGQN